MPDTRQQTPADRIRATLAAKAQEIKGRRDLSNEGRGRQLARAFVAARDEMTKLRRKDTERTDRRRAELQQRLFGNPRSWDSAATISYRDAQDRSDKLSKPDEAAALLERAIMSGDDFLGRAVAMRAMSRIALKGVGDGWAQIVDTWVEHQPEVADDIQELIDIIQVSTEVKSRFATNMAYTLQTPPELRGKNIEALAREADRLPE